MNRNLKLALIVCVCGASWTRAQGPPAASQAQQVLTAAAANQKYTFLVFFRDNSPQTQGMIQAVKRGVDARSDRAAAVSVNIADPAERAIVARFDVSRAPMPLTVAVAPNGAMTGLCPKTITDQQIAKALVSPAAAYCIKSMQDGKLVLACVQASEQLTVPAGVQAFCSDPQFKQRTSLTFIYSSDPAEVEFLKQLEVDPASTAPTTVFLAPPGVIVGKFGPTATKEQMAAALHAAGKCCDDPNCKHNHAGQPAQSGASRPANQSSNPRKNQP